MARVARLLVNAREAVGSNHLVHYRVPKEVSRSDSRGSDDAKDNERNVWCSHCKIRLCDIQSDESKRGAAELDKEPGR